MNRRTGARLKLASAAMACLAIIPCNAHAYQLEGFGFFGQGSDEGFGVTVDSDVLRFGATYYLRPVSVSGVPLSEHSFFDKAASLSIGFSNSKFSSDSSALEVETDTVLALARFVTAENFIAELGYGNAETDNDGSDTDILQLGFGKYLDNRTTVVGTFNRTDVGNFNIDQLGVVGRRLADGSTAGTYLATEGELRYIKADDDTGFGFSIAATYYLSEQLGLEVGFDYQEIEDADSTTLSIDAEYFLSPQLAVAAEYSRDDRDDIESDLVGLTVTGRF